MIEREKTFLAKYIPDGLGDAKKKELVDIYLPPDARHPHLRIRKNGDSYEITKKVQIESGDASRQKEYTVPLTKEEYDVLSTIHGRRIEKFRYYYSHDGKLIEFDVFLGDLDGLVLVDVEFETDKEKDSFIMPDFCLVDITQEEFIAGGMLCGKTYDDLESKLSTFGYKKLTV